jgi:DNA-binding XRE family transcriptional regulator
MVVNILGSEIRKLRTEAGETLGQTAEALKVDRSHLNKIELGKYKPSEELLNRIIAHFSVKGNKVHQLRQMAGFEPAWQVVTGQGRKEEGNAMQEQSIKQPQPPAQVSMDPSRIQILYTDSIFVSSSEYGLVLNVAQRADGQHHHVVARVGMSFDHAKKLLAVMNDHLQKYER